MAQVIITINYREYPISCDNGQEIQIMKLGRLLDEKAKSLTSALGHINENQLLAMVGLLLADELSELKKTVSSAPSSPCRFAPPCCNAAGRSGIFDTNTRITGFRDSNVRAEHSFPHIRRRIIFS